MVAEKRNFMNCYESARRVSIELTKRGQKMAAAESCTGGQIAHIATSVVGASKWFDVGFVTYSNEAKISALGVSSKTLSNHTAVSKETVVEMLDGVFKHSCADYALAVTGVAGPSGGTLDTPVGLVFIGLQKRNERVKIYRLRVALDRYSLQSFVSKFAYDRLFERIVSTN